MIDGFTIALLTLNLGKSEQDPILGSVLNAIRLSLYKPGFTKSHTTLDSNRMAYDFVKLELQNLIRLWDHMTSLAESCPDLADCVIARLLESWEIPRKTNYRIYKKFETAETGNLFKNDVTFWKDLSL